MGARGPRAAHRGAEKAAADTDRRAEAERARCESQREADAERFDVARASCYDAVQRDRLLAIVEAGFGGLPAFNDALKETMRALKAKGRYTLVKKNGAVSCAASP